MSKNTMPMAWLGLAGLAGLGLIYHLQGGQKGLDQKAFKRLIKEAGITDPQKVWDICLEYRQGITDEHIKTKAELIEAKARIAAGEEICRVGQGLADVRKMMRGKDLPSNIRMKQMFGEEISEEEMEKALEAIRKEDVPLEVKAAIIAHWWTQLWQLFVPWGILTPKEIEEVEDPFFRLVGPENREAALRAEVFSYKRQYESYRASFEKELERKKEDVKRHVEERASWRKAFDEEREAWRKEKEALLQELAQCKAENAHVRPGR